MARQRTEGDKPRLAGAPVEGERRPGMRAIGGTASRIAAPIVARNGGGLLGRLKAEWLAVVGSEWAGVAWPEALGRDGALKLRVAPAAALELQHRAPLVIERINRYFGRDAVMRLALVQGPLPLPPPLPAAPPEPLSQRDKIALDAGLAGIADPELRAALNGLGELVLGSTGRRR